MQTEKINAEIKIIDSLLRSKAYALEMAETLDAAYYTGIGQTPLPFLAPGDDTATVLKSEKEEAAATKAAAFYALECSVGLLCGQTEQTPYSLVEKIATKTADSNAVFLLSRFANATWKASQPFRSLDRITRPVFACYNLLPEEEAEKDYKQVSAMAIKLLPYMQDVKHGNTSAQLHKLQTLMQDAAFTFAITGVDAISGAATISKSVKEQKIAVSVASFYALECGLNFFVAKQRVLPSAMLDSIINNTISNDDKIMFARFANAAWKAGQPFRGLSRIKKDNFIPAAFLSDEELQKDFVQIQAAAKKLRSSL